eukprot:TRINITY_DN13729_c0_g1_i1.p1 TRINITY_DN13729_c0_g1~~TRINITY_DN13729_c0_g1_i1.p1  ORF type:complete len:476 (+),score=117.04 TRINITY_DN13729_c0_g1_i1:67-1494(+)
MQEVSNFSTFISQTAPVVPGIMKDSRNITQQRRGSVPNVTKSPSERPRSTSLSNCCLCHCSTSREQAEFSLRSLWDFFDQPMGVPIPFNFLDAQRHFAFLPLLSGFEIFVKSDELIFIKDLLPDDFEFDASSKESVCISSYNAIKPFFQRLPFIDTIKQQAKYCPFLMEGYSSSLDLEKSWFSVLWQPIYTSKLLQITPAGHILTFHRFEFARSRVCTCNTVSERDNLFSDDLLDSLVNYVPKALMRQSLDVISLGELPRQSPGPEMHDPAIPLHYELIEPGTNTPAKAPIDSNNDVILERLATPSKECVYEEISKSSASGSPQTSQTPQNRFGNFAWMLDAEPFDPTAEQVIPSSALSDPGADVDAPNNPSGVTPIGTFEGDYVDDLHNDNDDLIIPPDFVQLFQHLHQEKVFGSSCLLKFNQLVKVGTLMRDLNLDLWLTSNQMTFVQNEKEKVVKFIMEHKIENEDFIRFHW